MSELPYVRQPLELPVRYAHGPDSFRQDGVPRGRVIEFEWDTSAVFPGTTRRCLVYVPAQYSEAEPASLMVFQDGPLYADEDGDIRAPIVLDNLIHKGEMPVTIGVFVGPGESGNRNVEYDSFSDAYATFLLAEILPEVQSRWHLSDDPDRWGICGGSSGGNCAFTVAWMRPDRFRRVISFLGSFTQIKGGNPNLRLIAEEPVKPLRVFLQAATRDLRWNEPNFNWFSTNLRVAAALADRGYDLRLIVGDGGHSPNHGGVLLPDALRWIWRTEGQ